MTEMNLVEAEGLDFEPKAKRPKAQKKKKNIIQYNIQQQQQQQPKEPRKKTLRPILGLEKRG